VKTTPTDLPGVLVVEPRVFGDDRGFFFESYTQNTFDAAVGAPVTFVQDNHSRSARGVLRGLHWQDAPHAQGKLVRVVAGEIYDVAVDLRHHSPTFGRWFGIRLSAANRAQLWLPAGLGHGFLVTSEFAEVLYKATDFYAPASERSIRYDDPELAIDWPDVGVAPVLSTKDAAAGNFGDWRKT